MSFVLGQVFPAQNYGKLYENSKMLYIWDYFRPFLPILEETRVFLGNPLLFLFSVSRSLLQGFFLLRGVTPLLCSSPHPIRKNFPPLDVPHQIFIPPSPKVNFPLLNNNFYVITQQKLHFQQWPLLLHHFYFNLILFVHIAHPNFDFNRCAIFTQCCFQL